MDYTKEKTKAISFPLGGIGAGCIGLAGNGALIDWEIFNAPNKMSFNGLSHFAVRSEKEGKVEDYRILHGDEPAPYTGGYAKSKSFQGFGWGPFEQTLCNWPHFRKHTFSGTYPVAEIEFGGEKFPAAVRLTAWSVLIPGNSRDSSLPAAFFEITLTAQEERDFTVIGALDNPWNTDDAYNEVHGTQLTVHDAEGKNEITLSAGEPIEKVSFQTESFRGAWKDHQEKYLHDVMLGGRLPDRAHTSAPESNCPYRFGLLGAHVHLKKGESHTVRWVISWHVPECCNNWSDADNERAREEGLPLKWHPWYTTQWQNSRASGLYALSHWEALRRDTFLFQEALAGTSLTPPVLDGITANLSVLKSPTCLRLEDGTFWGWEGVGIDWGSCPGSCAHVWNYAQALAYLFPDLERSMREAHLKYGVDEYGGLHFRLMLPLGIHARPEDFRPCADGQFGEIMKFYRDWKISGSDAFLKQYWPTLKRMMAYAWSPQNADRWDPERTGVLQGRQHHTLDMELFGPNVWLTAHYLGALKAMAQMALQMGEPDASEEYLAIYQKGRRYLEESGMFNGEFFIQPTDLCDRNLLQPYKDADAAYWDKESQQLKYQLGDGCPIDAPLAQWYASMYGLGELYSPEMNKKTLQAIYRYNFKGSMRDVINCWRIYSLDDEGGTLICTWPKGGRPVVPLPYHSETMTGFEWAFAAHLVSAGLVKEGERVAAAIRQRFDGERRNPWNEFECGSNYARSLASYGMMAACSGAVLAKEELTFRPVCDGVFFWSIGTAWGRCELRGNTFTLTVLYGELSLTRLNLPGLREAPFEFAPPKKMRAGEKLSFG